MFDRYNTLFLQKNPTLKRMGRLYNVISNKSIIGTVEETNETINSLSNQLLRLSPFSNTISLQLQVSDLDNNVLGMIKKKKGYYNDFTIYSKDDEQLATIQPTIKMKSSTIKVIDINGKELVEATSGFGATAFTVIDCQSQKQISSIKRRSLVYESVKENLLNDDGYYIENNGLEDVITLALIAIGIILDLYYFDN